MVELTDSDKIKWLQDMMSWTVFQELIRLDMKNDVLVKIYDEVQDEESNFDGNGFSIKSVPEGKQQKSYSGLELWVSQKQFADDWYAGFCYIKLAENKYLCWGYST